MATREKASQWVNGYAATGAAMVTAVCHLPGQATATCVALEIQMCWQIGRMYLGPNYGLADARAAASAIGLTSLTGKILALEASKLLGPLGWPLKATLAGALIKALGVLVIAHYESGHGAVAA